MGSQDYSEQVPTSSTCSADEDLLDSEACEANLALRWMTEVSSSVYATPLIHDLYSDGHKDVIVPTFVHYLEVQPHLQRMCCHGAAGCSQVLWNTAPECLA